jgi:hypothetical protein
MGEYHKAAGLAPAIKLLEDAAKLVPLPRPPQPIAIADYGAANGNDSLLPITAAIRALRQRTRPDHAVLVAHTDRPDNGFTALFETLTKDPDSYLNIDAATFPSAVGRAFYTQILPSSTIALGWSSLAIHRLSRIPRPIPDHIQISYSNDSETRRLFARQAAHDWHEFVAFRGRELAPGGRLVVATLGLDRDGKPGFATALDAIIGTLRELVGDGLLSAEEAQRMCIPIVGRSERDFLAPFAPSGRFEGLSIAQLEFVAAEDRFWTRYQMDRDANAFGANWAATLRDLAFPALLSALDPSRADPRATLLQDRLEAGLARRLADTPAAMGIPLAMLVLEKRR